MAENAVRIAPIPLPATRDEMLARKTMRGQTLNDYVDAIHVTLWDVNDEYRLLLDAVYDEDAVEGSLAIDNAKAAEVIREYAREKKITYIGEKKLATLVKALNVVLRRYKMSRKERAVTVGGEVVEG